LSRAAAARRNGPAKQRARDHLFISYAWEDAALAEWLTRKLTAEGYRVWCDRFKLLGGESYPNDIDIAIKSQTFRMIALLSRSSLHKPNPISERTLALNIAKERRDDFLIPLNIDDLRPTELDWMVSPLTFIPFSNWATGLQQLLAKLSSIDAPRPIAEEGKAFASETFLPPGVLASRPETLFSNCFRFRSIPRTVFVFRPTSVRAWQQAGEASGEWPSHSTEGGLMLAFEAPIGHLADRYEKVQSVDWRDSCTVLSSPSRDVVACLLRESLLCKLARVGLTYSEERKIYYFPVGLLPNDCVHYVSRKGRQVPIKVTGVRRRGDEFRYHIAPTFRVRQDIGDSFVALLRMRLFITDLDGRPLERNAALTRRKLVAKSWFNHQWLTRQMAVCDFLSGGGDLIPLGYSLDDAVTLSAKPFSGRVGISVLDGQLQNLRSDIPASDFDCEADDLLELEEMDAQ